MMVRDQDDMDRDHEGGQRCRRFSSWRCTPLKKFLFLLLLRFAACKSNMAYIDAGNGIGDNGDDKRDCDGAGDGDGNGDGNDDCDYDDIDDCDYAYDS